MFNGEERRQLCNLWSPYAISSSRIAGQRSAKDKHNDACKRIDWLINNKLVEISVNGNGWEALYQDPNDRRYWLLTYPQSHMHGGGPPLLKAVTEKEAKEIFNV